MNKVIKELAELSKNYAERVCNGQFPIEYTREQVVGHTAADFEAGWNACLEIMIKEDRNQFIEMANRILSKRDKAALQPPTQEVKELESRKYFPLDERLKKIDLVAYVVDMEYCAKYDRALQLAEAQLEALQTPTQEVSKSAIENYVLKNLWCTDGEVADLSSVYKDRLNDIIEAVQHFTTLPNQKTNKP